MVTHQRCRRYSKAHKLTDFTQPEFSWTRWVSCKAIYYPVKEPLQPAFKDYLTVSKTSVPAYCISLGETWKQKKGALLCFQTIVYLTCFNYCLSSVLTVITVKFITSTNKTLIGVFFSAKAKKNRKKESFHVFSSAYELGIFFLDLKYWQSKLSEYF